MKATPTGQMNLQPLDPEMRQAMLEELAELERFIRKTEREKSDSNKAFKEELDGFRDRMTKILARLDEDEQVSFHDRVSQRLRQTAGADGVIDVEGEREPGSDDTTEGEGESTPKTRGRK